MVKSYQLSDHQKPTVISSPVTVLALAKMRSDCCSAAFAWLGGVCEFGTMAFGGQEILGDVQGPRITLRSGETPNTVSVTRETSYTARCFQVML